MNEVMNIAGSLIDYAALAAVVGSVVAIPWACTMRHDESEDCMRARD